MKKLIPVIILIQFIFSCSSRKNIPEITPNINAERVINVSINPDIFTIIPGKNSILLPDLKGNLSSISNDKDQPVVLAEYKTGFVKEYFLDNDILALFPAKKKDMIFFDLKNNRVIYTSKKKFNLKGIGRSHFIHYEGNRIDIINFQTDNTVFSKAIDTQKLIDCNINDYEVVCLFEKSILIYNIKSNSSSIKELNENAVSPLLRNGEYIYFGDNSRALVKYSLKKGNVLWKYRFQKLLKIKPVRYKNFIIASPEDNNTYLITRRGGLKDWYRSQSGRLFDPILMKEHLAVILRTENGTSINYYGLNKRSVSKFKDKTLTLKFPPVYFKGNLYSAGTEGNDPLLKLVKIGNKFGSTIKLDPENGHEVGRAIKIQITSVNMYKPEILTEIYNGKDEKILSRQIPFNINPSFVWVPETGGNFTLKITTKDVDGVENTEIKQILVTDTGLMYKNLQMKLHNNCDDTDKGPENKNEKEDK